MAKKLKNMRPGQGFRSGPGGLSVEEFARWYRAEEIVAWQSIDFKAVAKIAKILETAEAKGRQVFLIGNGGSAATASHLAVDFCKTAWCPGKKPLRAVALTDNAAFMTAIGNDLGYDQLFVRQLENLLGRGDVVFMISGSGNSPNLLKAAKFAKKKGAKTIALVGFSGGKLKGMADAVLHVESEQYGVIEDLHMAVGSILAFYMNQRT
jgi:D-sedoheptulose 7-phosphate isomerase